MPAVVVMGVSGSGKTSVARILADGLSAQFVEADALHPRANKDKMAGATPLTDADRLPWLRLVAEVMRERTAAGADVVVACSALRRDYRDVLRTAGDDIRFVLLSVPLPELERRLDLREGHFMPTDLLGSQLATLEPFSDDDPGVVVDASGTVDETVEAVLAVV